MGDAGRAGGDGDEHALIRRRRRRGVRGRSGGDRLVDQGDDFGGRSRGAERVDSGMQFYGWTPPELEGAYASLS